MGVGLYILLHTNKKIKLISPTFTQSSIIMGYLAEFIVSSPGLRKLVEVDVSGAERLKKQVTKTRITFSNGCDLQLLSASGSTTGGVGAERLMGHGGDLIILDESCLIAYDTYRTRISRMLGDSADSTLIEVGNPFNRLNQFYEHWLDPHFYKIHINWQTGLTEGRTTQEFIDEQRRLLSPQQFRILYDADFPDSSDDTLISEVWLKKAQRDIPDVKGESTFILGCDIARYGEDLTVLTYVEKINSLRIVRAIVSRRKQNTTQTKKTIIDFCSKHKVDYIIVDDTGVGGGVTDDLEEYYDSDYFDDLNPPEVVPVIVGSKSSSDRFTNKKSELFWNLRDLFEQGNIIIPKDLEDITTLIKQLSLFIYEVRAGKNFVIDNQSKSPDYADSLCFGCYDDFNKIIIDA